MGETLENDLGYLLNKAVGLSRARLDDHLREIGLTERQWGAVRHVWRAREEGRTLDVATLLAMHDIVRADLDSAIAEGLLALDDSGTLEVTARSERLVPLTAGIAETVVTKATSGFTAEEMATFVALLRRYVDAFPAG